MRVLRRLLVRYRAAGKIDKHLYHELYHLSKGNTFKHKRALIEHVSHLVFRYTIICGPGNLIDGLTYLFPKNRFRRPRLRDSVSACSRRKWTPSVPRTRPPANDDRSVSRPSVMLCSTRLRRSKGCSLWVFLTFLGGAEVELEKIHQSAKRTIPPGLASNEQINGMILCPGRVLLFSTIRKLRTGDFRNWIRKEEKEICFPFHNMKENLIKTIKLAWRSVCYGLLTFRRFSFFFQLSNEASSL